MSGGGGTQTVVNKTEIPQWVQEAGQRNLAAAYDVSRTLQGPYEGQRVASMTPGQISTIGAIANNYAMAQPAYAYAQQMAAQAGGYQPTEVSAGQLSSTDLSPYMNPYTQSVLQTSLDTLNQQRLAGLNQASDAAIKARAFGGSRQAYTEQQQFPLTQLQIPLQALGVTPYGQTNTQTGPGPSGSGLMTGLGAAASAASILATLASL